MKYENECTKLRKKEIRSSLVKMWLECQTYEQFMIEAEMKFPDVSKLDLLMFKVFWFSKRHPAVMSVLNMLSVAVLIGACQSMFYINSWAVKAVSGIAASAVMAWWLKIYDGDLLQDVRWHESGCPRD